MKTDLQSINKEQRRYVLKCGNGFTCYGFDVLDTKIKNLCKELNVPNPIKRKGTKKAYLFYSKLIEIVRYNFKTNGIKSNSELIPEFIGKEGKRVEIIDKHGDKRRFIIGKSTGWIPCHLEIKKSNSYGGGTVYGYPFKSIKFLS